MSEFKRIAKEADKWIISLVIIAGLLFSYLFFQNFVFSKSLDTLQFREIDDVGFQLYIKNLHTQILTKFKIYKLTGINEYAYGWLYWFPLIVITLPFQALSAYFGIDWPLIVLPRQISLILIALTTYNLFQIFSIYTKNNFLKFTGILLFLSFPTTAYFSMRFGTVAQVMFFSSLSFYLTARKQHFEKKDLTWIAITLAAAGGTKLSGLLISPLIALILLDRFKWKINKKNLKAGVHFISIFLPSLIFFSNPKLFFAPFSPSIWKSYSQTMSEQLIKVQTNFGDTTSVTEKIKQAISGSASVDIYIFPILISGLLFQSITATNKKKYYKRDFLYIAITLILAAAYLIHKVQMGCHYITIYYTAVSFLLPIGAFFLEKIRNSTALILGLFLLISNIFLNKNFIMDSPIGFNAYFSKAQTPKTQRMISLQKELQDKVAIQSPKKLYILREYTTPPIYSNIRPEIEEALAFDNIHIVSKVHSEPYDIIGFDKSASALINEEAFKVLTEKCDSSVAESLGENRRFIKNFLETKTLNSENYSILLEKDEYIFFQRKMSRT